MDEFLASTEVVDSNSSNIVAIANELQVEDSILATCRNSFQFVRDEIAHSFDEATELVSCRASEVLEYRTGICYAKSILLAAILRANRIPAGFGYQRLATDDSISNFCLHGFNFVWLHEIGWFAVDARGNRPGIKTFFEPPSESLAFPADQPGEQTSDQVLAEPLPQVIAALQSSRNVVELESQLPDW